MGEVLISVVVPVYNAEKYLSDCVESILGQSYAAWELILVDDGSTDDSGAICDSYEKKEERVRVIHQKNGGVTRARAAGLQQALGQYIYFVDADDWLESQTLKLTADIIETHRPKLISLGRLQESKGESRYLPEPVEPGFYVKEEVKASIWPAALMDIHMNNMYYSMGKVAERELLFTCLEKLDAHLRLGEDAVFSVWLYALADSVYVCGEACYHYRVTEHSASNGFRLELINQVRDTVKYFENRKDIPIPGLEEQLHRYVVMVSSTYLLMAAQARALKQLPQIKKRLMQERFRWHFDRAEFQTASLLTRLLHFMLRRGWIRVAYVFLILSRR